MSNTTSTASGKAGSFKKRCVAVLGAGKLGSAVATLLARAGHDVAVWARRPGVADAVAGAINAMTSASASSASGATRARAGKSVADAVDAAELVCFCVPTQALREVGRAAGEVARGDQIALHGCRGVESAFTLPHEIIRAETCIKKIGVLGGPLYLDDAERGRPLVAVLASRFDEVQRALKSMTASATQVRIHSTRDVVGVEVCGAISNVAQIAAGIAEGLGLGPTDQGLLLTRGLGEAMRIGGALGAERTTFTGLAGVGDLIPRPVTTTRKHRTLGIEIGRAQASVADAIAAAGDLEGLRTAREGRALGQRLQLALPLVEAVDDIVSKAQPAAAALERVLSLDIELDAA